MHLPRLHGKQSPTVEFFGLDADPNRLAATWRVFFDYGAALGDFRAAYRSKGAAQSDRVGGMALCLRVIGPRTPRPGPL